MTNLAIQEKRVVYCIYCGADREICSHPAKLATPLRLYCPSCGVPRSECQCPPAWATPTEREARGAELRRIKQEVDATALADALAVEQEHNRTTKIVVALPHSFLLHALGLVGDRRIVKHETTNDIVGELLSSYPTSYDSSEVFPCVGRVSRIKVHINARRLANAARAAKVGGVSINTYLTEHLGRCFIALDNRDVEKTPAYCST